MDKRVGLLLLWPLLVTTASSALLATAAETQCETVSNNWPRWRGPNVDGISNETSWTHDWPESGPRQLWTSEVGTGFSSVSVFKGRLYTMGHPVATEPSETAPADGQELEVNPSDEKPAGAHDGPGDDAIWCLDADTGDEIWTYRYPCKLVDKLHEGGPAATPTIHDGRLYTVSKEGDFFCLNAETGELYWKRNLQEDLGVEMPYWGFSGSALIEQNLVILEAGSSVAYDRLSGELVWKSEKFRPSYSSPICFDEFGAGNRRLVASFNNDVLLILDATNGTQVAQYEWVTPHPTNAATPIIHGNTIFISSGYKRGCTLLQLTADGLETQYENLVMSNHMNSCVLLDGHLYGFDGNSHSRRNVKLTCMEHASGAKLWSERGLGTGSLLLSGRRLIVLGDEGELVIAKADPSQFQELARAQVISGKCWTMPVLCNGRLYVRNAAGQLVCLDLRG